LIESKGHPIMHEENETSGVGVRLGTAAGWLIAPVFFASSFLRHARTFHPSGPSYHARVTRHPEAPPELATLADRLTGRALLRFSGALWKSPRRIPDVLGCAVRLRRDAGDTPEPAADDQDLLFATIRRPWTMGFAPLTTNTSDYLANDYFGVSPFDVPERERIFLRLHPDHASAKCDGTRDELLASAVRGGRAALDLEVSHRPFGPFRPLVTLSLERAAQVDGEALRFLPFRHGRGVRPRGFLHALRAGVYALSQSARPEHADPLCVAAAGIPPLGVAPGGDDAERALGGHRPRWSEPWESE
jgi:hypothetical protein